MLVRIRVPRFTRRSKEAVLSPGTENDLSLVPLPSAIPTEAGDAGEPVAERQAVALADPVMDVQSVKLPYLDRIALAASRGPVSDLREGDELQCPLCGCWHRVSHSLLKGGSLAPLLYFCGDRVYQAGRSGERSLYPTRRPSH